MYIYIFLFANSLGSVRSIFAGFLFRAIGALLIRRSEASKSPKRRAFCVARTLVERQPTRTRG